MTANPGVTAAKLGGTDKAQAGHALYVENFANSVLMQPDITLGGFKELAKFQTEFTSGLATAKEHAHHYLNDVQPAMIKNSASIGNYFALHNAVLATLPPGSTPKQWIADLNALKDRSQTYRDDAKTVAKSMADMHDKLAGDTADFSKMVSDLNTAVNGDGGVQSSLSDDLDDIQSKINGEIAGCVVAGLAIVGGVMLVAIGGVADLVTAGTSTPLVAAGVVIVAGGVGGEYAAAKALEGLYGQKAKIIHQQQDLTDEVKFATGVSSGYTGLKDTAKKSARYAGEMHKSWEMLTDDLDQFVGDLNTGILAADKLRELFLTAANTEIAAVTKDLDLIKQQLAGVDKIAVPAGKPVATAMLEAVEQRYAA